VKQIEADLGNVIIALFKTWFYRATLLISLKKYALHFTNITLDKFTDLYLLLKNTAII